MKIIFTLLIVCAVAYAIARLFLFLMKHYAKTFLASDRPKPFMKVVQEVFPQIPASEENELTVDKKISLRHETAFGEHMRRLDNLSIISALGDSAWMGVDMMHNLSAVNEHIYDALSHMAGIQLSSIGDLHQNLENWSQHWYGGLTGGALTNLQGHVAEQIVADHLQQLGHHVQFAEHSNQVGWDLLVDNQPVNVKDVSDMASLYQHFEKYPYIPVIANADIDGHVDTALHIDPSHGIDQLHLLHGVQPDNAVILDGDLNHDAVVSQVHDATDAITGHIEFHIPLITLTLSSFREVRLLSKNHTDIATSFKNIGLDVAGTGLGGFAGAKLGATLGTILAPGTGTVIGGVLGGVAGAFAGRFLSNSVKTEPLNQAKASYQQALTAYQLKLASVDTEAKEKYDCVVTQETARLKGALDREQRRLTEFKDSQVKDKKERYVLDTNSLAALAQNAHTVIDNQIDELNVELQSIGYFDRFIWPSEQLFKLKVLKRHCILRQKELELGIKHILDERSTLTQEDKTNLTFELLCAVGVSEDVDQHLRRYKETTENIKSAIESMIISSKRSLAEQRQNCLHIILATVDKIKDWAESEVRPLTDNFRSSQDALLIEMRKLGVNTN